jgi:hypothetical protein
VRTSVVMPSPSLAVTPWQQSTEVAPWVANLTCAVAAPWSLTTVASTLRLGQDAVESPEVGVGAWLGRLRNLWQKVIRIDIYEMTAMDKRSLISMCHSDSNQYTLCRGRT